MSCGKCDVKSKKKSTKEEKSEGSSIGKITHYYDGLEVGIVELKAALNAGDKIKIKGHTTDIDQEVTSMQVEHKDVEAAKKGDVVGLKVTGRVREGDQVYKVK
ncbi:MAG: translation elongation factor-like protein [Patescibacteria group bacterium]